MPDLALNFSGGTLSFDCKKRCIHESGKLKLKETTMLGKKGT
jgi:hypothetical protein